MTFNDILDGGCLFQGPVYVVLVSFEGRFTCVYEGDGEDIPHGEPWGEGEPSHVYYDRVNGCMTIEIEEEI